MKGWRQEFSHPYPFLPMDYSETLACGRKTIDSSVVSASAICGSAEED